MLLIWRLGLGLVRFSYDEHMEVTAALSDLWEPVDTFEVTCTELKIRVTNTNNFDNQFGPEWSRLGFCEDLPGLLANC